MERYAIAIIGGGLVGASLALALQADARRRGWRLLLVEPHPPGDGYQPSYDARSSALSYGSRRIYERLGVWPAIAERAEPIVNIHVSDRGRFGSTRLAAAEEGVPALGYVAENAWLGQCLWSALDPSVVEWRSPAEVQQLAVAGEGYVLQLDSGDQVGCDLAVLADGGRSPLRERLGVHARERHYEQVALIANVTTAEVHAGRAFERFGEQGPLALLPLPEGRSALVWTLFPDEAERLLTVDDSTFLRALQAAFGYRLGAFTRVGARHCYPLALVEAQEQVRPHLVVLGNAAHSLHPVAGQGFNLSLRDTQALADVLIASAASPGDFPTLQGYHRRQQADQRLTTLFSDQLPRLFGRNEGWLVSGRNLGLLGLDLVPSAKRWFARQAMGLAARSVETRS